MTMSEYQRKEIIKLDGLTILMGMALIANMLIVGFFYRYHGYQLYVEEKAHNLRMKELNSEAHQLKEDIIAIEGVKTWNDSAYSKLLN